MYSFYVLSIQMILCASLLASETSYGQKSRSIKEIKVSIDFNDENIIGTFNKIEKETGFTFVYLKNQVSKKFKLSGNYNDISLYDLLSNLSRETGLRFQRVNNNINVKRLAHKRQPVILEFIEDKTISGKVTGELGEGLPGVNVLVKDTNIGTVTDVEGNYIIKAPDGAEVLVFSSIGYVHQEVEIGSREVINIRMSLDTELLSEVVVVGYGTQKKANLTGAVDNINFAERIGDRPVPNISLMLQGALPNVNFSTGVDGGEPGAALNLNVRGIGSLTGGSGTPYILLDGVPITSTEMNTINPNDVKEVTILKDAASAAIYGARGSYGVILITTKQGRKGEGVEVSYSGNIATSHPVSLPEMANSLEFANAMNDARANIGASPWFDDQDIQNITDFQNGVLTVESGPNDSGNGWQGWANRDWFDEFYEEALRHSHNLSVSGGSEKTSFYISGGFLKQYGNFAFGNNDYERANFTVNMSNQATDWLSFDVSAKYSREKKLFPTGGFGNFSKNIIYHQISRSWPTSPLFNPDGDIINANVNRLIGSGDTEEIKNRTILSLGTDIEPIDNWVTRVSVNWSLNSNNLVSERFINTIKNPDGTTDNQGYNQNTVSRNFRNHTDMLINVVSKYNKSFDLHNVGILVGYEQRLNKRLDFSGSRADLITKSLPTFSTATGTQVIGDALFDFSTKGVFGRLNYNFDEKYLFEANVRYDGSSYFKDGNRWGFFPSFSVGYNLAKEDYWAPLENTISFFKIRASWGSLGNHDWRLAAAYQELLGSGQSSWIINGQRAVFVSPPNLLSPDLTWETATTFDIGLDMTIFERLQINFDWYNRVTSDMVGPAKSLPATLGTSAPRENNAELSTKGWELVINWNGKIGEIDYSISGNLSDNQTTILEYENETGTLNDWFAGQKHGDIYGLTTVGLFQSDQEAQEAPDQSWISNTGWRAGDIQYADLDGNGRIDNGDWTTESLGDYSVIGNQTPRYTYGLDLSASYKGLRLSVLLQGVAKRDLMFSSSTNLFWGFRGNIWQNTIHKQALDYWSEDNRDAYFPRPYINSEHTKNTQRQTRYLQSGAYMRVKNIQLSYSFPQTLTSRWGLNSLQVYVSGENLLTFTKLQETFDPETVGGFFGGGKIYPLQRVLSAGLNVSF